MLSRRNLPLYGAEMGTADVRQAAEHFLGQALSWRKRDTTWPTSSGSSWGVSELFFVMGMALINQKVSALDNPESGIQEVYEPETLEPVIMDIPEAGEVLVCGDPFGVADQLDDNQGDNVLNAQGDCGVVSVANIVALSGLDCSEDDAIIGPADKVLNF